MSEGDVQSGSPALDLGVDQVGLLAEAERLRRELQSMQAAFVARQSGRRYGFRIEAGLPLTGEEIRAGRKARGWSVPRLIWALNEAARREGLHLMTSASLKTSISRWENNHCRPDELHARLLEQVLGRVLCA